MAQIHQLRPLQSQKVLLHGIFPLRGAPVWIRLRSRTIPDPRPAESKEHGYGGDPAAPHRVHSRL